ncbi:hypothetical protein [Desulfomarina sp.]
MNLVRLFIPVLIVLMAGCSGDNPKTANPLLRDKKIGWQGGNGLYYEFTASGRLLGCGGDFPEDCCVAGQWESLGDNGSFRYFEPDDGRENRVDVTVTGTLASGALLSFDSAGKNDGATEKTRVQGRVTVYEDIAASHEKKALSNRASVTLTRYRDNVFVLELMVEDPEGEIKKIYSDGDEITTEVMVTNGKRWTNNPPIILSGEWNRKKPIRTEMTLVYHDGRKEYGVFLTDRASDKSEMEFEDDWF